MKKNLILFAITLCLLTQTLNAQIGLLNNTEHSFSSNLTIANKNFLTKFNSSNNNSFSYSFPSRKFVDSPLAIEYNPKRDSKRLLYNTGLYAGAIIVSFSILWVMPESVTNWDKEKMKSEGIGNKWKENVQAGPVWDEDDWVLNYVMHPWFGGVYYMSARGSGFKAWESFAYSTLMSTVFWEYGIEAFAEVPSWQDLIVTPVLGSVAGEGFFYAKKSIRKNGNMIWNSKALGRFTIFLMDPFNAFINGFGYKTKNKVTATSMIMPVGYDPQTHQPIWGMQLSLKF